MTRYFKSKWKGHDQWKCRFCAFDTLDQAIMIRHVTEGHKDYKPTASCIMVTRNRQSFVDDAVKYFLKQTYEQKELVVVADGMMLPPSILDHPCIKYIHSFKRLTIGAARNMACAAARGEFIVHWDDDDWSAPERVAEQIAVLAKGYRLCGLKRIWCGEANSPTAYEFLNNTLLGASLAYHKEAWQEFGFEDLSDAEDTSFENRFDPSTIFVLDKPEIMRYRMHQDAFGTMRKIDLKRVEVSQ